MGGGAFLPLCTFVQQTSCGASSPTPMLSGPARQCPSTRVSSTAQHGAGSILLSASARNGQGQLSCSQGPGLALWPAAGDEGLQKGGHLSLAHATTPEMNESPALPHSHPRCQLSPNSCNQSQLYRASWEMSGPSPENSRQGVWLILHSPQTDPCCCWAMDPAMALGGSTGQDLTVVLDGITGYSHQSVLTTLESPVPPLFIAPHPSVSPHLPFLHYFLAPLRGTQGFWVSGIVSGMVSAVLCPTCAVWYQQGSFWVWSAHIGLPGFAGLVIIRGLLTAWATQTQEGIFSLLAKILLNTFCV